jgi:uroporphyrinogen-III decarboxylase
MFIKPENWNALSPLERRKLRLDHWQNAPVEFISPEAEANYRERITRARKAYDIEPADRIIADLGMGVREYALRRKGLDGKDIMYYPEKLHDPIMEFHNEFQPDLAVSPWAYTGPVMDMLGLETYIWGGQKLPDDLTVQFVEREYMTGDEYKEFIADPSGFFLRKYIPRMFSNLGGLATLPNFPQITEIVDAVTLAEPFGKPPLQEALNTLMEAGNAVVARQTIASKTRAMVAASGFPSGPGGAFCKAPFDFLADSLRGTKGILTDLYRRPDEVIAACEAYVPVIVNSVIQNCNMMGWSGVLFPLHKGADGFMSQQQFERFYWPTFKAVMMAFYEEGLTNALFVEGTYDSRLETIAEMPEKSCYWFFDQTDMRRVKEILGGRFTIGGNVPASLMVRGSTEDLRAYCDDLVDLFEDTPGYIMTFGCGFETTTDEKVRAFRDSVR